MQITGYFLHFIPTITGIIIFRRVDNKEFNFIIKYMVHDTKLFLIFNPNFQQIYFLYICIGLSTQRLMAYLYRHLSDQPDILIDSVPILWDSICSDAGAAVGQNKLAFSAIQSMAYCFSIFLRIIRIIQKHRLCWNWIRNFNIVF